MPSALSGCCLTTISCNKLEENRQRQLSRPPKNGYESHGSSLEISAQIIEGHTLSVILDEAANWEADLIVLGSHGYRRVKRFLLGSVSSAVASHADCSIEIVRRRQTMNNGS
jgi:nucleotide-binding universal stress UspA family protein